MIELLVVLAILAVLVAVLPSPFAGLPSLQLRAAEDELVDTLRRLHDDAIRRGGATELTLDTRSLTYSATGAPSARRLPPVVEAVTSAEQHVVSDDDMILLRFFADGSATGETIRLLHGSSARQVRIDWLTGRARRDD
jgi:general secretion pathway protein H